jgi:hypothetical protein
MGVLALCAVPASASIILLDGDHPQPSEQNIMFESGALIPGVSQIGDTNKSNTPVLFDTNFAAPVGSAGLDGSGQAIVADGIGQANIVCVPGATPCADNFPVLGPNGSSQLTSLEMKPFPKVVNGKIVDFGWTDVIANPDFGNGTMNVFVQDNFGNNFDFTLSKGQNFFTLVASGGEVITDVQMTEAVTSDVFFGWNDFKQPRVSGVCVLETPTSCVPIPVSVPEPLALPVAGLVAGVLVVAVANRKQ